MSPMTGCKLMDTLVDAFWMHFFFSRKKANITRQESSILDDDWQKRRAHIAAEHKHADARTQLAEGFQELIAQDSPASAGNKPRPDSRLPVTQKSRNTTRRLPVVAALILVSEHRH